MLTHLPRKNPELEEQEEGETAMHLAVAGGFKDCVLLLVRQFPQSLHSLIRLVGEEKVDEGCIYRCLEFLCFQHDHAPEVLPRLAELASRSGHDLVNLTSNVAVLEPRFLTQIRILSKLSLQFLAKRVPNPFITFANRIQLRDVTQALPILNVSAYLVPQIEVALPASSAPPAASTAGDPGPSTSASAPALTPAVPDLDVAKEGSSSLAPTPSTSISTFSVATGTSDADSHSRTETTDGSVTSIPVAGPYSREPLPTGDPGEETPSTRPQRTMSLIQRLTISRRKGKKKEVEQDAAQLEEKRREIMKEVVRQFGPCWECLERCLEDFGEIDVAADGEALASRIPALVHGYYLFTLFEDSGQDHPPRAFVHFVDRHTPALLSLVRRSPRQIFEQFHFLLEHESLMDRFMTVVRAQPFADRVNWYYQHLQTSALDDALTYDDLNSFLMLSRVNPFEVACSRLGGISAEELKRGLNIRFEGEAGTGAGVRREWFDILSREVLNPDYALFKPSSDGCTVQPNAESAVNPDHLNFFRFAGRVIGLALYYHQLIDVHFTRSFYKHMLGIRVNHRDLASLDPTVHQSLLWILDNDITDGGLELYFFEDYEYFGSMRKMELKPNGAQIMVTEENKREYVQLLTELKMTVGILPQLRAFLEGFHELIPRPLIAMFNEYEIELLLCGVPEINVRDWRANTVYTDYTEDQDVIRWFWEIVEAYPTQDRVLLLQFVTGSSRVPMGGFAALEGAQGPMKFTISRVNVPLDRLPTASTCFNLLKFPEYTTKDMLQEKIRVAVFYGSKGFEFG